MSDEAWPAAKAVFRRASREALLEPRAACDHLHGPAVVYTCLCCPRIVRCLQCHIDHIIEVDCPSCGAALDPEVLHTIVHDYEGRGGQYYDASGEHQLGEVTTLVVNGAVCDSCALDNDLRNVLKAGD